jgi:hypothetical protein
LLNDPVATQVAVDAASDALFAAMLGVEPKGDVSQLDPLLEVAAVLTASNYTPDSWLRLAGAVAEGQRLKGLPEVAEYEVTSAVDELAQALDSLVLVVNKASLTAAISLANVIINQIGNYIPSTVTGLVAARDAAVVVRDNDAATQAQVNAATSALLAKVVLARPKPNPVLGQTALASVEVTDLDGLTAASAGVVEAAGEALEAVLASSSSDQAAVDAATAKVAQALVGAAAAAPGGPVVAPVAPGGVAPVVPAPQGAAKAAIKLTPKVLKIAKGKTAKLIGQAASGAKVTWKSSKAKVAKVTAKGVVKAKKTGQAIAVAKTKDGKSAKVRIKVLAKVNKPVKKLTVPLG